MTERPDLMGIEAATSYEDALAKLRAFLALDLPRNSGNNPMWMSSGYTITWGDLRLIAEGAPSRLPVHPEYPHLPANAVAVPDSHDTYVTHIVTMDDDRD